MKKFLFIAVLLLAALASHAQQNINFQGKLYNGSTGPVNDPNATFEFNISALSWTQPISGVAIVNGLYSVTLSLPQNVFDSANSSRQMTVSYNHNPIETVTLYAPLERDPTVRSYIRDSVQWANIHNKPTVDTSFTNEIQVLSKNGDTLKLSNGGGNVLLPRLDTLRGTTVNGILTVIDTSKDVMITIPTTGTYLIGLTNPVSQSFKATANGKLRELKLTVSASAGSITISFYSGVNTSSPSTASKSFSVSTGTPAPQTFDVSSLSGSPNFTVNSGSVYSFKVEVTSGTLSILADASNPYPFGTSSISNTTDIPFDLSIDNSTPPCLTFDNNCRVGIGTSTPSVQLEVKGRVKDQTGFLVPVGTVISYAGRNIPQGWLLCDGRAMIRADYPDLFEAVDTAWGSGNSSTTFNIPDMRGMFLRGVDTSSNVGTLNNDPDHSSRTASNAGGNSRNAVGSKQSDMFASHGHSSTEVFLKYVFPNGIFKVQSGSDTNISTVSTANNGGSETRPKNVYVYYIIKY